MPPIIPVIVIISLTQLRAPTTVPPTPALPMPARAKFLLPLPLLYGSLVFPALPVRSIVFATKPAYRRATYST